MNERKYRVHSLQFSSDENHLNCLLPETFISSLRQLFSILDKTNCGYISFDVFKRYFDCSSLSTLSFLNELENESKINNYFISFNLLINVIKRSFSRIKQQPPIIRIPKSIRSSISFPVDTPQIPLIYQNFERNISNPVYYAANEIDLSQIRSLKQFEFERNLLIQTCDTLDRVKFYLTDRLLDMKEKQKSYCRYLAITEAMGLVAESMYNRDLIADLFKLAYTVIEHVNYDFKKSSSSVSINEANNQLKEKDNQIKLLETEKRVLLKELIEMRQQHGTIIPIEIYP
ncbi:unnamed protein product [Adineta steineri]|uniref:EF-hand domain-containing protein n=1 Tax=Adineta steineri TaxID=433720 RepID=A0A814UX28_9BILA|nr:unnamed protein product [Adineta steineri]CAF3800287.1 unnamed protein product [Adineta steineri]